MRKYRGRVVLVFTGQAGKIGPYLAPAGASGEMDTISWDWEFAISSQAVALAVANAVLELGKPSRNRFSSTMPSFFFIRIALGLIGLVRSDSVAERAG